MSELKQIEVFTFDELTPEIQNKVMDRFRDSRVEDSFYVDDLTNYLVELLTEEGLPTDGLMWDLAGCKYHPTISFEGPIDLKKFIDKNPGLDGFKDFLDFDDVSIAVDKNLNVDVELDAFNDYDDYDDDDIRGVILEKQKAEFRERLEDFKTEAQAIIDKREKELWKVISSFFEDVYSDERIKEDIEINEYRFDSGGRIVY